MNTEITILVKALNEEKKIDACLQSCVREAENYKFEIIVVDSLSTDRTVELAQRYPVTVVQFINKADCGPGSAVELGYRHSSGELIYVLDGDMTFEPGFLSEAVSWLKSHPHYAGVGGVLTDTLIANHEDRRRASKSRVSFRPGEVDRLGGGGLYRRVDIDSFGYLAHLDLRSFEEGELGFRLRTAGRRLYRLPIPAVRHAGHGVGSFALILRLWRSGRLFTAGALLRIAARGGFLGPAVREFIHPIVTLCFWFVVMLELTLGFSRFGFALLAAGALVVVALLAKKKNISDAFFSLLVWHLSAVGLIVGAMRPLKGPRSPILARVLSRTEGKNGG